MELGSWYVGRVLCQPSLLFPSTSIPLKENMHQDLNWRDLENYPTLVALDYLIICQIWGFYGVSVPIKCKQIEFGSNFRVHGLPLWPSFIDPLEVCGPQTKNACPEPTQLRKCHPQGDRLH